MLQNLKVVKEFGQAQVDHGGLVMEQANLMTEPLQNIAGKFKSGQK